MGKVLIVGVLIGLVLTGLLNTIAKELIEYGRKKEREVNKKNE